MENWHKREPLCVKIFGNWLSKSQCSGSNFLSVQLHRSSHPAFVPGLRRGGTKGLGSPGRSPGNHSIWGMLSPDPFSAVAAAEQLLGCVRFGFQPCKQPGVADVGAGGVWRMDGGQVQTLLLLTYGWFAACSFSALYNFSLDLMDTPCRGHLAHQQQ